jgi:hypothetical protein
MAFKLVASVSCMHTCLRMSRGSHRATAGNSRIQGEADASHRATGDVPAPVPCGLGRRRLAPGGRRRRRAPLLFRAVLQALLAGPQPLLHVEPPKVRWRRRRMVLRGSGGAGGGSGGSGGAGGGSGGSGGHRRPLEDQPRALRSLGGGALPAAFPAAGGRSAGGRAASGRAARSAPPIRSRHLSPEGPLAAASTVESEP